MQKVRLNLTCLILLSTLMTVVFCLGYAYAKESILYPSCTLRQTYDDNIFLANEGEQSDWITTLIPGFTIEPKLKKHKFTFGYHADLHFFADHNGENTYNHTVDTELELNFNKGRLNLINMFRYFSERSGTEDLNRIPRTQDHLGTTITFGFHKLDLSLHHTYQMEKYRSSDAIGSFFGRALTYKDLERDENEVGVEVALKLWSKTALLLSLDYGRVDHDSGNKSDSSYFAFLTGLRGKPWDKATVEAKIGFRNQDYDDFGDDFTSIVFKGSFAHHFTERNRLLLNFLRTTEDTIYTDNAYYESTSLGLSLEHDFTERVMGNIDCSYIRHDYPHETTEAGRSAHREDDYWITGIGLSYKLPKWFTVDFRYQYSIRDSNFATYDYKNNLLSIGIHGDF